MHNMELMLLKLAGLLLLLQKHNSEAGFIYPQGHTLPGGLQSLDGSDQNGECRFECLDQFGSICGNCDGNLQLNSALVDGVYPEGMIDTTLPDWAMDFFTVSRNRESMIRIGFTFPDRFILRGIELKLFNCASLGTAIPNLNVYGSLAFPTFLPPSSSPGPIGSYQVGPSDLSCDTLSTIIIPTNPSVSFNFYFVEFSFSALDSNTAVYLAEIRFSNELIVAPVEGTSSTPHLLPTSTTVVSSSKLAVALSPAMTTASLSGTTPHSSTGLVTSAPLSFTTSATTSHPSGSEADFIRPQGHTLPDGLQSLDGSDRNGGCRLECLDQFGNICGNCDGNLQLNSVLVDGVYPEGMIDTTLPDWAMDFFTVSRNGESMIRIGFDFPDRFILRGIELKLFYCASLGTAIPNLNVYGSLLFPTFLPPSSSPGPIGSYQTTAGDLDCNSLTTITIPISPNTMFRFYFIEMNFLQMDDNIAVYLAEVRFILNNPVLPISNEVSSTPQLLSTPTAGVLQPVTTPLTTNILSTNSMKKTSSLSVLSAKSSAESSAMSTTKSAEFTPSPSSSTVAVVKSTMLSSPNSSMPTSPTNIISSLTPTSTPLLTMTLTSGTSLTSTSTLPVSTLPPGTSFMSTSLSTTLITSTRKIETVVTTTTMLLNNVTQPATISLSTSATTKHTSETSVTEVITYNTNTPFQSNTKLPIFMSASGDTNTPTKATPVPPSNPSDTLGNSGLTTIVSVLVSIIVVLILILLIGAVIVLMCRRKKTKTGNYNVKILNNQGLNLTSFYANHNTSQLPVTDNDDDYEVMHKGTVSPTYAEISVNPEIIEPIYSEVKDKVHNTETNLDEEFCDAYTRGNQDEKTSDEIHPYSTVVIEAPPIPKKTPELYRALKVEAKQRLRGKKGVKKLVSSPPKVFSDSKMASNEFQIESVYLDLSASVQSGLALLSKPVFDNMNTNPEYESASDFAGSYPGEKSTFHPSIPMSASCMEFVRPDNHAQNYDTPMSPANYAQHYDTPKSTSRMESSTYSCPKPVPVLESNREVVYKDIDAGQFVPAVYDTVYCEPNGETISGPDAKARVGVELLQTSL